MDFNLKSYKVLKVKNYFKKSKLFFIFHSVKLKSTEEIRIEQNLKKLKLKYYKVFNGTTLITLKNSVYTNFTQVICGVVLFIEPKFGSTSLDLNLVRKELSPLFSLLSLKLNNKIYSIPQLEGLRTLSYKQNMFNLHRSLEKYLKYTHIFTGEVKKSK